MGALTRRCAPLGGVTISASTDVRPHRRPKPPPCEPDRTHPACRGVPASSSRLLQQLLRSCCAAAAAALCPSCPPGPSKSTHHPLFQLGRRSVKLGTRPSADDMRRHATTGDDWTDCRCRRGAGLLDVAAWSAACSTGHEPRLWAYAAPLSEELAGRHVCARLFDVSSDSSVSSMKIMSSQHAGGPRACRCRRGPSR